MGAGTYSECADGVDGELVSLVVTHLCGIVGVQDGEGGCVCRPEKAGQRVCGG